MTANLRHLYNFFITKTATVLNKYTQSLCLIWLFKCQVYICNTVGKTRSSWKHLGNCAFRACVLLVPNKTDLWDVNKGDVVTHHLFMVQKSPVACVMRVQSERDPENKTRRGFIAGPASVTLVQQWTNVSCFKFEVDQPSRQTEFLLLIL